MCYRYRPASVDTEGQLRAGFETYVPVVVRDPEGRGSKSCFSQHVRGRVIERSPIEAEERFTSNS